MPTFRFLESFTSVRIARPKSESASTKSRCFPLSFLNPSRSVISPAFLSNTVDDAVLSSVRRV